MNRFLKITFLPMAVAVITFFCLSPSVVNASAFSTGAGKTICQGVGVVDSTGGCDTKTSSTDLGNIIAVVLNILSLIVGITAVIMIIVAGLKYILSGGESAQVSGAKNTLLFAVIGIVIVALAQIIVHFVLNYIS